MSAMTKCCSTIPPDMSRRPWQAEWMRDWTYGKACPTFFWAVLEISLPHQEPWRPLARFCPGDWTERAVKITLITINQRKDGTMTKSNYPTYTMDSAPANSKPALEQMQKAFGVVPNIAGAVANSPKLINSLVGVFQQVHTSSLKEPEIQIVLLTDAVVNSCTYAIAFHTALALQQGVSAEETEAIREGSVPKDKRFAALSILAKTLIEKRGHLSDTELDLFIAAGFTKEQ